MKLFIVVAFIMVMCVPVSAEDVWDWETINVNIDGFDCSIAKGQKDIIITDQTRDYLKSLIDIWKNNHSLVFCITGKADGESYLIDDDAMNPAIALGRCGLGFKLLKDLGATDLSRMRFFVEEYDEIGPRFRGVNINLESSAWASTSDLGCIYAEMEDIKKVLKNFSTYMVQTGFDFIEQNSKIATLENKIKELESDQFTFKFGAGITFLKKFPYSPMVTGMIGRDGYFVEIDISHSLSSKNEVIPHPYGDISQAGNYRISTKFTSARLAYLLKKEFLSKTDLFVKAGWHWQEHNAAGYSGYYKRYDGPELGIGLVGPLNGFDHLEFSANVYWYPAQGTVYPDPTQSWESNRVRLSLSVLKPL